MDTDTVDYDVVDMLQEIPARHVLILTDTDQGLRFEWVPTHQTARPTFSGIAGEYRRQHPDATMVTVWQWRENSHHPPRATESGGGNWNARDHDTVGLICRMFRHCSVRGRVLEVPAEDISELVRARKWKLLLDSLEELSPEDATRVAHDIVSAVKTAKAKATGAEPVKTARIVKFPVRGT